MDGRLAIAAAIVGGEAAEMRESHTAGLRSDLSPARPATARGAPVRGRFVLHRLRRFAQKARELPCSVRDETPATEASSETLRRWPTLACIASSTRRTLARQRRRQRSFSVRNQFGESATISVVVAAMKKFTIGIAVSRSGNRLSTHGLTHFACGKAEEHPMATNAAILRGLWSLRDAARESALEAARQLDASAGRSACTGPSRRPQRNN